MKVIALWRDNEYGPFGFIGAISSDGIPFALENADDWDGGERDSLRRGWKGNVKVFSQPHPVDCEPVETEALTVYADEGPLMVPQKLVQFVRPEFKKFVGRSQLKAEDMLSALYLALSEKDLIAELAKSQAKLGDTVCTVADIQIATSRGNFKVTCERVPDSL